MTQVLTYFLMHQFQRHSAALTASAMLTMLLCAAAAVHAQTEEELLPPEEAFVFSSRTEGSELIASWTIADGYYLYQDKFAAVSQTPQAQIGAWTLPAGDLRNDPLFGEVVTYTGQVELRIPVHSDRSVPEAQLEIFSQGCNEPVGVCYPPVKHDVVFPFSLLPVARAETSAARPAATAVEAAASPASGLDLKRVQSLGKLFSAVPSVTEDNLLDVDKAFVLSVWMRSDDELLASFEVAQGYYLYRDKIKFEAAGPILLQAPQLPSAQLMNDAFFGETLIYPSNFDVPIRFLRESPVAASMVVTVEYQGCAKDLICYPPVQKTFNLALPALVSLAAQDLMPGSASDRTGNGAATDLDASWLWLLLTAFGTGLLLTFTPCVLPLIPILSSIIAGCNTAAGPVRAGGLSIIYVGGTVVAYATVGAVAGATGEQLQAYFQNVWAIAAMSAIFVLMALSLFGLYEIKMPAALETRVQQSTMRIGGGKAGAVFVLGILSALVVSACVSPLLISILSIAIAKADPVLGAALMTAMALGMGAILIAIGFGFAVTLPKAGAWMDRVKQAFGLLLLAVAIYLLGNIPQVPVLLLWAALFIITGVYLGATSELPADASGWRTCFKGLGIVLLLWGVVSLLGGILGNRDVLRPLPQLALAMPAEPGRSAERLPSVVQTASQEAYLIHSSRSKAPLVTASEDAA